MERISDNWLNLDEMEVRREFFRDSLIPPIYQTYGFFLCVNGERYYFKPYQTKGKYLGELLGEKVTRALGLTSVHYELAKFTYQGTRYYGVLSKWARKEGNSYQTLSQAFEKNFHYKSEEISILGKLEKRFPDEPINVEFRDLLARDYLTKDYDRLGSEIMIEQKDNHTHLGYMLDYGDEFQQKNSNIYVSFYYILDLKQERNVKVIQQDERLVDSFKKVLKINLEELLEEVKKEKTLRITKEEELYIKNWQDDVKSEIKKSLSL